MYPLSRYLFTILFLPRSVLPASAGSTCKLQALQAESKLVLFLNGDWPHQPGTMKMKVNRLPLCHSFDPADALFYRVFCIITQMSLTMDGVQLDPVWNI